MTDSPKIHRGTKGTVLVTGGAGYIGSHACKALANAGYLPVVCDNLSVGHEWAVKWGPLEVGDILDRESLDRVFETHRPDAVMHFAAFAQVGESVRDPGKYYRNNVLGSLTLLEAMRDHGCQRIIFSSSCATYGEPVGLPIDESAPQRPINPYGASKLMVERILGDFGRAHGLTSVALRYFNAAGADAEAGIGWQQDPPSHLIPLVLDAASGRRSAVTVFGSDYATPDGTCIRDYIHVDDLAEAHVLAIEAGLPGGAFEAFNLGTGQGHSVTEIVRMAEKVTGREIPVFRGERRAGDPACLVCAGEKAARILRWRPKNSNLETILNTAWRWHQEHLVATAERDLRG